MATRSPWLDAVRDSLWARDRFSFAPHRVLASPTGECAVGTGPRLAFCGFPSDYSLAFLLALLDEPVEPVAIITSPRAHPAILGENALSQIADHVRVPLLRLERINSDSARAQLEALRLDGVVMASFDQIVHAEALTIPRHGWLNVHPSALPLYRGPEPVHWAIAEGAARTGISLHRAVPTFDAGPLLAQRLVDIAPDDDAATLTRRLCAAGVEVLGAAVSRLLADDPGDPLDLGAATYRPAVGHRNLDSAPSAVAAERLVRAGAPDMPAYTRNGGTVSFVLRAQVLTEGCMDHDLRYPDGCLRLLASTERCPCDGDGAACARLEE